MAVTSQVKPPHVDATIAELKKLYGERLSTAHAVREQHGKDISFHEAHLPDAVVFVESAEEAQQVVKTCARHKTPIIAFGTAAPARNKQGPAAQRARPRRGRPAGRPAQAAEQIHRRPGPFPPDGPGARP